MLMCMMRYEGIVLACIALFAFVAVGDYQIRPNFRKYLVMALMIAGFGSFFVVVVWGEALFVDTSLEERMEMLSLEEFEQGRIPAYVQWALVLASGTPIFWILTKRVDCLSVYYLIIAVLYFCFLCSLSGTRPYMFGPFVFAAAAAGVRAIAGFPNVSIRRIAMIAFFPLAIGSFYVIAYHMPSEFYAYDFAILEVD